MTVTVRFEIRRDGFPALANLDFSPPLAMMSSYLSAEIGEMFATEGASRNHAWEPLSEKYAAQKEAKGRSPQILQLSGNLRNSFRPLGATPTRLVYGTTVQYAGYHDSDQPRRKLPQRKLIRILPRDLQQLERFMADHITRAAGGA